MASQNSSQVYSGKNARIIVAGVVAGYAQGVSWTEDYGIQPVTAVGSFVALEHQPTVYNGTGNIQSWAIKNQNVLALTNIAPNDVLNADTITLEVYDEVTGNPIRILEGVSFSGASGGVNAGQLATEGHPFRYLSARAA
jgi:hypothetical protein